MRTLCSFGATSSSTPLFFAFSPSFQVRKSSLAKGSISWPWSEPTVATTSWMPDLVSSSASFDSRASRCWAERILASSTTRPVSGGKVRAPTASPAQTRTTSGYPDHRVRKGEKRPTVMRGAFAPHLSLSACAEGRWGIGSEFHLRWRLRTLAGSKLRHRFVVAEQRRSPQQTGERPEGRIVCSHCFDVVAPRHRYAIFSAFELRLQGEEVLVRLEIGIVLADGEEPAQRAGELSLRILELLQLVRIGQLRGIHFHLSGPGPGLDDRGQHLFFLLGIALHGSDKIGDEVGAALVVVLNVRPPRLRLLLLGRNGVVAAGGQGETKNGNK